MLLKIETGPIDSAKVAISCLGYNSDMKEHNAGKGACVSCNAFREGKPAKK